MMNTGTMQWNMFAQMRRVAKADARITGIDAVFGLLYVLAGFLVPMPDAARPVHVAAAPFVALSGVLIYLAARICGAEREGTTAAFYANLPRQRTAAYWAHAGWLALFAVALEVVICVGIYARLGAARPDQPLLIAPYMSVLPFLAIAYVLWANYGPRGRLATWAILIPLSFAMLVGIAALINWDVELRDGANERFAVTFDQNYGPALALAVLAGFFAWHGWRRWMRTQIGELS